MVCRKLGNLGVLAETAPEIATNRGNGEGKGAGKNMKKGFFFYGVNVLGDKPSINQGLEHCITVFTNTTDPALAAFDDAPVVAQIASNLAVFQLFIKTGFHRDPASGLDVGLQQP